MRKISATMAMGMMFVVLTASFAVADVSVDVDNSNTVNATGGNANAQQGQKQKQAQDQQMVNTTPRDFISAPIGPNLMVVTVVPESRGCIAISSQSFSLKEIENMKSGSFLEKKGGWFHGMFSSRVKHSVRVPFEGEQRHPGPIISMDWNVQAGFKLFNGDKKLGTFNCEGDYGYPLDATLGMCLAEAFEYTNMKEVYACYTVRTDAHSSGTAYSAGGAASAIPGSGDVATAGSVAATFGTSVAYANKAYDVELYAVQTAARQQVINVPQAPAPPVAQATPVQVCDWTVFERRIAALEEAVSHCKKPCLNNELLRKQIGDAYVQWFNCTGRTDKELLRQAIKHYNIGEKDFLNGREPDGTKTRSMKNAQILVYEIRYNWAWCVYVTNGYEAEMTFANSKGLNSAPEHYEELKF